MLSPKKMLKKSLLAVSLVSASTLSMAADYTLTYAATTQSSSHWAETLRTFQKYADEYTEGKFNVNLSFGGAMGNDVQLLQKSQLGSQLQGATTSGANLGAVVPAARVLDIPFIVSDVDSKMDLFYQEGRLGGDVVENLQKNMHRRNLHLLAVFPSEFRGIMTTRKEVRTPDDMGGLKIRVTPSAVERNVMSELDSGPTTLGISEVYTAMQTGTVDGLAIPPITSVAFALGEVGKEFNMLNFQPHGSFAVVNKRMWEGLPADIRENVQKAADNAIMDTLGLYEQALTDALATLKEQGVKVHQPSVEEQEAFREVILASSTDIAIDGFNKDELSFYEAVQKAIAN
ncbi:MAG: TRAP transporter substrate-binding protein [Endozoicomonas sp.]